MSNPEPTGGKSLEEILASIRKSLADEPPARQPEPPATPGKAAQPNPKPASPPTEGATATNSAGLPVGKLAAGLNGASRTPAPDDDLSELLATEPTKPLRPAPVDAPKPPEARSDAKDPLWFLTRLSAAAADTVAPGSLARARDAAKAPGVPVDEVKLSRPETLRPSLPPLFGAGSEPIPPAAPREDISTAKTEPRSVPRQGNGEATTAKAEPEVSTTAPAPTPLARTAPPAMAPGPRAEADTVPKGAPSPSAVPPDTSPTLAAKSPEPATEVEPVLPVTHVRADATPEPVLPMPEGAPAPGAEPVGVPPTRAFEQVVGELLEPVIRQWLQSNLPRLIEKAVREEVARAMAAERDVAKR